MPSDHLTGVQRMGVRATEGIAAWLLWPFLVEWRMARMLSPFWWVTALGLVLAFAPALIQALRSPRTREMRGTVVAVFVSAGLLAALAMQVIYRAWGAPHDAPLLGLALIYIALPVSMAATAGSGVVALGRERVGRPPGHTLAARLLSVGITMAAVCSVVAVAIVLTTRP